MRQSLFVRLLLAGTGLFSTCAVAADDAQFVDFGEQALKAGRQLWIDNCKTCHAYGVAGAPIPMKAKEWKTRVIKPRELLYDHAINGFFGPDDTMMPERGGNPELSDEQVRLAVDYMVTLAQFYIDRQSN